jgi:signal transduction histidine kinase
MKKIFQRVMRVISVDHPSPALKQAPLFLAYLLGIFMTLFIPGMASTSLTLLILSYALMALATILAIVFTLWDSVPRVVLFIPAIDLLAVGAFRAATGAELSVFTVLLVLPVIWFAAEEGRRNIAYAAAGASIALALPLFFGVAGIHTTTDVTRAIFVPLIFAAGAAIINEIARQGRAQMRSISRLAEDKERMLQRTVEYAAQLQDSEAKLREFERMFSGVWAAVTEQAVIGTDPEGLIDAWNPGATKLLGSTPAETEDKKHIFDYHLPEELEARARELNYPPGETVLNPGFSALVETARLGEAESREWTYVRANGTHVPVQLSVTKRMDEHGDTIGYLFVAADVTQAKEVARLKDEFVGLISHELRTPLSSILGYLELMRDDEDNPLSPEQVQYLGVAERNAHRLLRLVGDLLFTAQVESGKFPLDSRDISLESIVAAAIESAGPVADAAGIELVEEFPKDPAIVHGDPLRLGQAIDNLISNAVKFTPRGGKVTLAVWVTDTQAVITVRDTGMGIAASELDQLFGRFFRASTATRNAVPGVGLGLTITKAIVIAHKGEMGVQSEEGVGTTFSLTLPLVKRPVETISSDVAPVVMPEPVALAEPVSTATSSIETLSSNS